MFKGKRKIKSIKILKYRSECRNPDSENYK